MILYIILSLLFSASCVCVILGTIPFKSSNVERKETSYDGGCIDSLYQSTQANTPTICMFNRVTGDPPTRTTTRTPTRTTTALLLLCPVGASSQERSHNKGIKVIAN